MKILIVTIILLLTTSCDFVEESKTLFSDHGKFELKLKERFGAASASSFNVTNGHFVLVANLPVSLIGGEKIEIVYGQAYKMAIETFADRPDEFYLQVGGEVNGEIESE